jgi:hypothetical protein
MLFGQKWPKMHVFCTFEINRKSFKRCENDLKLIKTMGYSPCFLVKSAPNGCFSKNQKYFKKVWNDSKSIKTMGYSPCFLVKNAPNGCFSKNQKYFKKVWNDSKSIITMGCSPCFLFKNGQKCLFFAPLKLIENNLKGVKWPKIDQNHGL